eukprot:2068455-Amphidinium_carterae.1
MEGRSAALFVMAGDQFKLEWMLCSKSLLPACGMECATIHKPDSVAISMTEHDIDIFSTRLMLKKNRITASTSSPSYSLAPKDEALAAARQHTLVVDLTRKVQDAGPCTCFEWYNSKTRADAANLA